MSKQTSQKTVQEVRGSQNNHIDLAENLTPENQAVLNVFATYLQSVQVKPKSNSVPAPTHADSNDLATEVAHETGVELAKLLFAKYFDGSATGGYVSTKIDSNKVSAILPREQPVGYNQGNRQSSLN